MNARELAIYKRGGVAALQAEADRQLAARASRSRRTAGKKAPGREAKKAKRESRQRMAQIRESLRAGANGLCELDARPGSEAHHVISGPLRRKMEGVFTMLWLCEDCHRALHRGDLDTMERALAYCRGSGMHEAAAALRKRIDKVLEARRRPSVPVRIEVES